MYMYVCVYNEIKPPQTVIENFVHALKSQTNAENVEQMFQYLQSLQWAAKLLSLLLYNFFAREKGMWVSACRRRPGVRPAWRVQWLVPLPSTGSPLHRRPGPAGVNLCVLCITAALQHCSTAGRSVSISDQPGVWWQSSREMGHIGYAENIHHLPMALRLISPAHAVTCSIS